MKRVVVLRSNPVAPDPRVEKTAQALVQAGYKVTILGWDRFGDTKQIEQTSFGRIERIRISAGFGNGIKNLPHMMKWQLALFKWLTKHEFDIIHSCDFDTVLPAFIVGRTKKAKIVYDIFDFYSEMLNNTPSFIKKVIRKLDYFIINHVDAVIIVDDSRKEQIGGTHPKLLQVIYNTPQDIACDFNRPNIINENRFNIVYVGVLQPERGLDEMIEVVSGHPEWSMDIAGFGHYEAKIREAVAKHSNITFHGRINYKNALRLSNKADVLFALYNPVIPNHKYSSPNKLFEAMMLGKPVIVSDDSSMSNIVSKVKNGISIKYGDKKELENVLIELQNNVQKRIQLAVNSRQAYDKQYGWRVMEERLIKLYLNLWPNHFEAGAK